MLDVHHDLFAKSVSINDTFSSPAERENFIAVFSLSNISGVPPQVCICVQIENVHTNRKMEIHLFRLSDVWFCC